MPIANLKLNAAAASASKKKHLIMEVPGKPGMNEMLMQTASVPESAWKEASGKNIVQETDR